MTLSRSNGQSILLRIGTRQILLSTCYKNLERKFRLVLPEVLEWWISIMMQTFTHPRARSGQAERVTISLIRFLRSSGRALLAAWRITLGMPPKT